MDPRVNTPQEGLAQKFQKEQLLAFLMLQNTQALLEARGLRDHLQKLTGKAPAAPSDNAASSNAPKLTGALADTVAAFEKKLSAILGGATGFGAPAASSPTLGRASGAIAGLYAELDRSDAAPTAAQVTAIAATEKDSSAVFKLWQDFKSTDLPELNRQLKAAGLPELQLASVPHVSTSDDDADIE
jgi:hypothetical protein